MAAPTAEPIAVSLDVSAIPSRPAGAGRYVVELVSALAKRDDVATTLLTRRADAARWQALAPSSRTVGVAPTSRPLRLAFEQMMLGPVVRRLASPAVKVHHGPHYTLPYRLSGLPSVVTVHDMTFFDHPELHERAKVPFFRRAILRSARAANVVVCVSQTTADRFIELTSPKAKVVVVPHGVDHLRFRPAASAEEAAADRAAVAALAGRSGTHRDSGYLLYLGTIEPRKGVAELVHAFGEVASAEPDLELWLAGQDGWGAEPVTRAIAASGYPDRIRRFGYVEDAVVPALLRRARAVAYPSYEEGFGLPALEALACGVPLVTTSGTSMAEIAGTAAWTCAQKDREGLATALAEALGASAAEIALRKADGLAQAARYSWDRVASEHVAAYQLAAI